MATTAIKRKAAAATAQFRVAAIGEGKCTLESFNRRDFYKISLVTKGSPYTLRYGSLDEIRIDRPVLTIMDPIVPYAWSVPERLVETEGYFCVFNDEFIRSGTQLSGVANRLLTTQQSPVYSPDRAAEQFLTGLFARMRLEADLDYAEKDELFRSHLSLIFHEAAQMRRTENIKDNGPERVAARFIRLLNKQFPVDLPLQPISLKKASDFASLIAVHVNHLNTVVQKATGRSTTTHIAERIFAEAKSLLYHTDHSVSEIAFGLGFEYQSYFNRFFKKYAGITPSDYRKNFEKYK